MVWGSIIHAGVESSWLALGMGTGTPDRRVRGDGGVAEADHVVMGEQDALLREND